MGLPYSREYTKILENEATDRLHRKATPLKKTVPGRGWLMEVTPAVQRELSWYAFCVFFEDNMLSFWPNILKVLSSEN